jgi:transposase
MRGITRTIKWGKDKKELDVYMFFNTERAVKERNELYSYIASLIERVESNNETEEDAADISKYLIVSDTKDKTVRRTVVSREEAIENRLLTSGWMILLGNKRMSAQEAHDVYRSKDVVEKAFFRFKNNMSLNRLRVHSDERMKNKMFISFIALILISHIDRIMHKNNLYRTMTIEKLFITLNKLKTVHINGNKFLSPITKTQREIFNNFGVPIPS